MYGMRAALGPIPEPGQPSVDQTHYLVLSPQIVGSVNAPFGEVG